MKPKLEQIYRELSAGTLSQEEALARIRPMRRQEFRDRDRNAALAQVEQTETSPAAGTLLACAVWEPAELSAAPNGSESPYSHHHIILCDLPAVAVRDLEKLLPQSRCAALGIEPAGGIDERYTKLAVASFDSIQNILKSKPTGPVLIHVVVGRSEDAHIFCGLAGLLETAALENPAITGQLLFTDSDITTHRLAEQLQTERERSQDRAVEYAGNSRRVRRWKLVDARPSGPSGLFKERGVYLITGGLGGLGVLFAREIQRRTSNARIILTGRSALDEARQAALQLLQQVGHSVEYRQVDVANLDEVRRLILAITQAHGQLNGIIHSAGVVRDDFLLKKTEARFREVLLPKVSGSYNLDAATQSLALDFLLLFSSVAAWSGNAGQADYAAANGFMDQFAEIRNRLAAAGQRQGRTLSLLWPHWLEGGMSTDAATMTALRQRTGMGSLDTDSALHALHLGLASGCSHVLVMRGDVVRMQRALLGEPAMRNITRQPRPAVKAGPHKELALTQPADTANGLAGKTLEFLRGEVASVLKLPASRVDVRAPLETYGIDSIMAMSLTTRLEETFGALAKTLFFEYLTIDELAGYFVQSHAERLVRLFAASDVAAGQITQENTANHAERELVPAPRRGRRLRQRFLPTAANTPEARVPTSGALDTLPATAARESSFLSEPIAIVGLSGRYPESRDLAAFWSNLRDGKDCIIEVPPERWDWKQYYSEDRSKDGAHFSKWGGFIEGVDEFDPRFFNIAPREAHGIDPQERLFLQHTWMAIEDAGYTRSTLQMAHDNRPPGQVGVYAGVMYGEYNVSGSLASIANRVSYFLNLHGPSLTLDTMCSSSLTAIHLACQDLRLGRTSLAIAGGVNVSIHPNKYRMLSGGQFISSDGHCQSFGEGGDGYIPGEGVGVALLKRLSEARRDGNHIYGVIRGSALNHGGKTNGYTVPNPQAQADAIRQALNEANLPARHVSYIEAHGTGTKLGDPIEIAALSKAFQDGTAKETGFCRIGSAKSNIGHCESAAGIAGVTKVLLQMKHRQIVPSLHSRKLNPHIDFKTTPFVVNQSLTDWTQPEVDGRHLPRIAGISSFGAGGSNAHVLIEEYATQTDEGGAELSSPLIVPLSARTTQALQQRARDLLAFIRDDQSGINLASMAYTLQVGREAMQERVGFIAQSVQELAGKIAAFLQHDAELKGVFQGQVKQHQDSLATVTAAPDFQATLDHWTATRNLTQLLELWVKGLDLDWSKLVSSSHPPRSMSLPTYPFARERYWTRPAAAAVPVVQAPPVLHPLLHANTSSLTQHRYSSKFTGSEPFLEQGAAGCKALPALFVLETFRAAVERGSSQRAESGVWEFRQTVWGEDIEVTSDRTLHTVLFTGDGEEVDVEAYSSAASADEPVHCQSHAIFSRLPTPARIDLARVRSGLQSVAAPGERQLLEEVHLVARSEGENAECLLHPQLLSAVSKLLQRLTGQDFAPVSLACMRIMCACPEKTVVWARCSASGSIDVDLCDMRGNVCVQMIGLQWQALLTVTSGRAIPIATSPVERREIPLIAAATFPLVGGSGEKHAVTMPQTFGERSTEITLKKPTRIALADGAELGPLAPSAAKAAVIRSVTLDGTATDLSAALAKTSSHAANGAVVRLFDLGNGVFAIEMDDGAFAQTIEPLMQALHRAEQEPALKVLLLGGGGEWCGDRIKCNQAIERGLFTAVARFPYPVIAVPAGGATGPGFLLGLASDFIVCSEAGAYGFSDAQREILPTVSEKGFLQERLGDAAADFLNQTAPLQGRELKTKGLACRVSPANEVEATSRQLAVELAQKPQLALRLLKKHLGRYLLPLVENLAGSGHAPVEQPTAAAATALAAAGVVTVDEDTVIVPGLPLSIPLRSDVVSLSVYPEGVVLVTLHDRQAKNLFSATLVSGLKEAFAHIARTPSYKVVVLTGYDSYFVTGGTQETLLAIQKGEVRFTDEKAFELPMECSLPVIAAIQGHAIGGGWAFGMFADAVLLSEESRYRSPYMSYGFTPGAGSTLVFPKRIGYDLARETLLTGQEISGAELKARGLCLPILPRRRVVPAALALAKRLSRHSRQQLMEWKVEWTRSLRELREDTYQRELAMHGRTFVGQAETLANIQTKFAAQSLEPASHPASLASTPPTMTSVVSKLRNLLAQELHLAPEEIDETSQFIDLGLDSITGVTWIRKINEHYGTQIEATKVYSYPTLSALGRYVQQQAAKAGTDTTLQPSPAALSEPLREETARTTIQEQTQSVRSKLVSWRFRERAVLRPAVPPQVDRALQPIAVIGMAGQFAKSNDLNEFWQNLAAGRNCIDEVPAQRWSPDTCYKEGAPTPGRTNSKWLGALDEYDRFDPLFFNISPSEAANMDPQQRLFLQACWHGIENAGYNPQSLSGSQCGVFVGCGPGDYHQQSREQQLSAQGFTGAATSILAARIAYFLNLRGPCLPIDTACSSSLVAIATACDSLNGGNSDLALAGGVYVMSGPAMHIMTAQAGMLSTDGRCFTFDRRANGFVPGEGVGVVVLKRLADAQRDEDRIVGVIEGWGVNQDGKTNGITAPNEESQTRLMQSVYRKFGIDPGGIQLIEAHGTGTKLGDPIEIAGLKAAFGAFTRRPGYCALGSVKSNIGHCLTAAGAAGIIKLLLALKHRSLPPTIHFQHCNEHIQLEGSPFYINDSLRPWNVALDERRRAAISSFGFSGTNAHIVLAEDVSPARGTVTPSVVSQDAKIMVCLSARTEPQLRQKAIDLLAFIREQAEPVALVDLAYTLHVSREQMGERLGCLVGTLESLTAKLDAWVAGQQGIEDLYQGQVKRHKEAVALIGQDDEMRAMIVGKWLSERKLSKLLDLWVKGIDLDWNGWYGAAKPRRIELPAYPFAKDRYWIEASSPVTEAAVEVIHPLLHRNVSSLREQRYSSTFNGQEAFLEHGPDGAKIFPTTSLRDMARAAVGEATSDRGGSVAIQIGEIAWEEPLVIRAATEVFVALAQLENEGVSFEIYSQQTDSDGSTTEVIHARGDAYLIEQPSEVASSSLAQSWDGLSYLYRWEEQPRALHLPDAGYQSVLIVGSGDTRQLDITIRAYYEHSGDSQVVLVRIADETRRVSAKEWLCGVDDAAGFDACLQGTHKIDALYFLAMPEPGSDLARTQQANEVQLLRLVKCLKAGNRIDDKVDTYLLTRDNYSLEQEASQCGAAGVTGLGYSLAQGSYQFRVRNLDVSSQDLRSEADRERLLAAVLGETASNRGEIVKLQAGRRYRQTFSRLGWLPAVPSGIRHDGVYLILGGSGVVGRAITRNLIEKYQANVVWLGRSARSDEKVQSALQSFAGFGDKLLYVQTDTLQPESLRQAISRVKEKFGRIHGAVFSAMVFGIDNSIEQIPVADFRSITDVKTLGSVAFYDALKDEPLDFLCYFSSGQAYSFSGAAKVCGYAAGITFTDSFIRSLRQTSNFAMGTINWGAWASFVKERLSRMDGVSTKNMGAFDDREGFACFEQFVGALQQGGIHQVLCMRASPEVQSLMNLDQGTLAAVAGRAALIALDAGVTIPQRKIEDLQVAKASSELDDWFVRLLFLQVSRLIESSGAVLPATVSELCQRCGILDKYVAWMDSTFELFAERGCAQLEAGIVRSLRMDASSVWDEWQSRKQEYAKDPDAKPLTALVDECLDRLADILCGKVSATDVIFPNSSMEKVAPLYKDNATADTFNEIVANAVRAYLERRLELDPGGRIRILEVGAGTGGTSAAVFRALKPHQASVAEYCYTDLSKAFFFHAEQHYLPDNPYLVCRRLDIEQPIEAQGIDLGSYDLVIATNVLHATRNIRVTLRNCKAALRADGFILLNEMSQKSLATHLTFAMLDGWWLFQDPELRIPGCPGLYPAGWQRALEEEGFRGVMFPAQEGHGLGNQIVIARSDGVIRQALVVVERQLSDAASRVSIPAGQPAEKKQVIAGSPKAAPANVARPVQDIGQFVRGAVLSCLSSALKLAPESIDSDTAFADYGIDSILGVSFVDQLNARLSLTLNTAVIFEHSSVERLTRHVRAAHKAHLEATLQAQAQSLEHQSAAATAAPSALASASDANVSSLAGRRRARTVSRLRLAPARRSSDHSKQAARTDEIAVIGISGKFPKAQNVDEFWRNLVDGVDGVEELPEHYLDQRHFSPRKQKGKTRCKWGGVLTDRDCFDPLFFNLSPREAVSMNPHQRLVMQESWNALEDAGLNPKALSGTQTGIFVGSEPTGYVGETFTGVSDAIIASRLSYALNLRGPAFVVNTGCSASGVALHLACESLRNRESDLALAGGVNACMRQSTQIGLDEIDMLSPSGRCFTFDKAGDGTIISEGVAMVVLKRLDDALADGDPIYATIVASGINQDGASNGITAPNGESQEQLIRSVYDKFGIDPERISYVEAHGTGTRLGDPIETNALIRAFRKYTQRRGYCALGSAKSHIGHTAAAAGAIGLIKVLLSMRHRTVPKLLNFNELNPLIELAGSPFFVATRSTEWTSTDGLPRLAALNSFGHSGTNVHLVIKEHVEVTPAPSPASGDVVVPLSAKTKEQLLQKSAELLQFIRSAPEEIDFRSIAYTLQTGREAMEVRLALVARSTQQLAEQLRAYNEGEHSPGGVYQGKAQRNGETLSLVGSESSTSVARLWATGQKVTWGSLWQGPIPQRLHLPGYPFARERYWIDAAPQVRSERDDAVPTDGGESIEDLIDRIADESLAAPEGVRRLRSIV